jgi:ketosteroid isomerase-like protein
LRSFIPVNGRNLMGCTEIDRLMREFYTARGRGDLEAVLGLFSAEVGFQIASARQGSSVAIKANGISELRPLLALLIKTFGLVDLTIRSITVDGAQAAVHWSVKVRSRITGSTVATELIDIVEVRKGCIVDFNEVFVQR